MGNWLELKYLEWQTKEGGVRTMAEFADYLGIVRMTLSRWMNGRNIPDKKYVDQLADKLGPEIYDLMGLPRPDPSLVYIIKRWPALTIEQRKILREQAEQYAGTIEVDAGLEQIKRGRSGKTAKAS